MVRAKFERVRLIELLRDPGYSAANNLAVSMANAPFVVLLNNDVVMPPHTLGEMVRELRSHPGTVVAPVQIDFKGRFLNRGLSISWISRSFCKVCPNLRKTASRPFYLSLACVGAQRSLFLRFPLNESLGFYDDVEWGWRLNLSGVPIKVLESVAVYHKSGATAGGTARLARISTRNSIATAFICLKTWSFVALAPLLLLGILRSLIHYLLTDKEPDRALASLYGIVQFLHDLDEFSKQRKAVQSLRRISEREILKLAFSSPCYTEFQGSVQTKHDTLSG